MQFNQKIRFRWNSFSKIGYAPAGLGYSRMEKNVGVRLWKTDTALNVNHGLYLLFVKFFTNNKLTD